MKETKDFYKETTQSTDFEVFFGDIWSTKAEPRMADGSEPPSTENPKYVVILISDQDPVDEEYPDVVVAPISTPVDMACDRDLLISADEIVLSADENPFKGELMIELWNSQPMLKMNLDQLIGELNDEKADQLNRLERSLYEGGIDTSDIPTKTPIESESDPRVEFHRREIEETLYLRLPAIAMLDWGEGKRSQTIAEWKSKRDPTGCREQTEIHLSPKQIRRIREWTQKEVSLPECVPQLREREIALAAFMENLTHYQLTAYPDEWDVDRRFFVEPLIRFDVSPARSTLFDRAMVSINGWWVDVRPVSPKMRGVVTFDRRIFDSPLHADAYCAVQLEKARDGGVLVKIFGYLTHEDIRQLKLGYDRYRYAVDVAHFLPLRDLWPQIAKEKEPARVETVLGQAVDWESLDMEASVLDLPDSVYLRLLMSETAAARYIEAKQEWAAGIDGWQAEQIAAATSKIVSLSDILRQRNAYLQEAQLLAAVGKPKVVVRVRSGDEFQDLESVVDFTEPPMIWENVYAFTILDVPEGYEGWTWLVYYTYHSDQPPIQVAEGKVDQIGGIYVRIPIEEGFEISSLDRFEVRLLPPENPDEN